jgi:TRAP-type C4-dicarboxylate transport system permease small subunit
MMDYELHKLGLKLKFAYSMVGLAVGLACIGAGVVLGLNGVAGHTSWTASVFGLSTNLNDAAPGVIVFVVGIFMVFLTRFKVRHERTEQNSPGQQAEAGSAANSAPVAAPIAAPISARSWRRGGSGNFSGPGFRESIDYFRKD